jgi:type IV pilus assembly protein PilW
VQLAGYLDPTGTTEEGRYTARWDGPGVWGCDGAFNDPRAAFDELACRPGTGDAIALRYEAHARNSALSGAGEPLDCLGNGLDAQVADDGSTWWLAEARFYVATPPGSARRALYCKGAAAAAQPLLENVHDLQLRYGLASRTEPEGVGRYATAAELAEADWSRVVSVRACVVMTSADEVLDAATEYRDCAGRSAMPRDRRLYRTFVTTIALQNRRAAPG